ncbi:WD40 repeat domain-containing protein [Prevotella sp. P6B4]|uniref:WD40 repeat domain-containing protein n=1 Tax=Prevotella sp. P6B4 TaxID=1410614 RepID=UPI0012DDF0A0|nr:hypothetical protein [Prevotella sp. P6B4]
MKKIISLFVLTLLSGGMCMAQDNLRELKQKQYPQGFDNHAFGVFYYNGKAVYANRGIELYSASDTVKSVRINPAYSSIISLQKTKKGYTYAEIYNLSEQETPIGKIKLKDINITALAYTPDAKQLAVAANDRQIRFYDPRGKQVIKTFGSSIVPQKMLFSGNNYFLACSNGKTLEVWNAERGTVRKTITCNSPINDFAFGDNNSKLMVLTADGKLAIYETTTFNQKATIDDLGSALAVQANHDGKYALVLNSDKRISAINLLDPTERIFLENAEGGTSDLRFVFNQNDNKPFVIYNSNNALVYREVEGMKPYLNKMMSIELNEKLNQWMKQMPGETLEAYNERVNDETRAKMASEIEREFATKMAAGLLETSDFQVGDYNTTTKKLTLHSSSMPDIFLDVPFNELGEFDPNAKLQFKNVKYGLNPDDKFEMVYAEIYNPTNGKTYIFDNLERQNLAKMNENANFVPLEVIRATNMEETALEGIKEDIISQAIQEQTISDKTHISVNANAEPAVDADGKNIINYNVQFTYEVEEAFSARDDFKPGRYNTEESGAAMSMLKIMKKAFENDFAKYAVEGKRVKIAIKGTADASPIARAIAYDGRYGEFDQEPVYKDGELNNVSLNKKEGIATNDQLAFARAIGVKHYMEKELSSFEKMNRDYEYHIEVSKQEGSKYRRISVLCTFIDAF